jgi:hypothetical protein
MTKDLALLVGPDQPFQTTQEFLAAIDERLEQAMAPSVAATDHYRGEANP